MLRDTAEKLIAYHEGCELKAYWDGIGHRWTIGYGYAGPDVYEGQVWTQEEAEQRLAADVAVAQSDAIYCVGNNWYGIDPYRQDALTDMAYNLGRHKLSQFVTFLMLVQTKAWDDAATDLTNNTAWAKQLPRRCADICSILRTGEPLDV